jgi:acetyl-CoA synthetase (ADP-forming)
MEECAEIIKKAMKDGKSFLLPNEAKKICDLHQIPTPRSYLTSTLREAILRTKDLGFPVVLKIVSPQLLHKSEVDGVILNIQNIKELEVKYEQLLSKINRLKEVEITGILVEEMMIPSTEVIIGGIRDPHFGPTIMFGIGGIFTEVYADVQFRVAPIDKKEAMKMIEDLNGFKILKGIRGRPSVDINSIINILINVSNLMIEHINIKQLDLNPVIVYSDGAYAVDIRFIIG